jgi:deoxyribodipyrimidine photolyase-related protein
LEYFFEGKKTFVMENFIGCLEKKHVLMEGNQPLTGKWNYDSENRKSYPKSQTYTAISFNNVLEVLEEIDKTDIKTIGNIDAVNFVWPINREQSLQLLDFFLQNACSYLVSRCYDAK